MVLGYVRVRVQRIWHWKMVRGSTWEANAEVKLVKFL